MQVTTIGLDLAKNVFQIHGVDANGEVVVAKRIRRQSLLSFFSKIDPSLVGIEACGSAHRWARELRALGHEVKLMSPSDLRACVKRGKNDAADAAATCEVGTRPSMRFVLVKSGEQQSLLMLHCSRNLLIRQRTMLVDALCGHLADLGIVAAEGWSKVLALTEVVCDEGDERFPPMAYRAFAVLVVQMRDLLIRNKVLECALLAWHCNSETSLRLESIPGVSLITAAALAASVTDPAHFESGRQFAAWLGLVPRQNSGVDKKRLGRISKMGNRYLRRLLFVGATALVRFARNRSTPLAA